MSSAFVHLAVGALVALAVRIDWRLVALGAVVAEVPDIDHLWGAGMRSLLHTAWFLVLLPSAVATWALLDARLEDRWRRLGSALPVLMQTHMLLDLFPQASEESSRLIPLFSPVDGRLWEVAPLLGQAAQPTALSSLGIVTFLLAGGCALAVAAPALAFWLEGRGRPWAWVAWTYGLWWPALLGFLVLTKVIRPA